MTKNEADRIIDHDLSDAQTDMLNRARAGFGTHDADNRTLQVLIDKGLVRVVNYEHVRATNSIEGVILTEDGERLMQNLDNRPGVERQDITLLEDGEETPVTTVNVKDPSAVKDKDRIPTDSSANSDKNPTNAEAAKKTETAGAPTAKQEESDKSRGGVNKQPKGDQSN